MDSRAPDHALARFLWQLLNQRTIVNRFGTVTVLQRRCRASELGRFASGNPAWRSADAPLDAGHDR
ncbi:hypothetical protein BZM26_18875 [Paraburkholderia strydomiana]|nr:hypothetical protein BZM26_18875 [Paraburkholderia strydomiana]